MVVCLNDKYKPEERFRAVVEHGNGLLVVSAAPGIGKTFSLLRKIQGLLDTKVDPKRIYYLTFANSIVGTWIGLRTLRSKPFILDWHYY